MPAAAYWETPSALLQGMPRLAPTVGACMVGLKGPNCGRHFGDMWPVCSPLPVSNVDCRFHCQRVIETQAKFVTLRKGISIRS